MNNVSLIGRLVNDPELRYTSNNSTPVCNFTLAVDRRFKTEGQPETDFINIVVWSKTAEFVSKWFIKGLRVGIVGRIQTRSWKDKEGGKHYVTEIVAESVYFADAKKEGNKENKEEEEDYFNPEDIPF